MVPVKRLYHVIVVYFHIYQSSLTRTDGNLDHFDIYICMVYNQRCCNQLLSGQNYLLMCNIPRRSRLMTTVRQNVV